MIPRTDVLTTIELIRDSFEGSVTVFTQGSCVKFCMILKNIYPQGKILYDLNHAIFEIDGLFYDINGFAKCTVNHMPIESYGILTAYKAMSAKHKIRL